MNTLSPARTALTSLALLVAGAALVLVGVLVLGHIAVTVAGISSLIASGLVGASVEDPGPIPA